jgi:hypothetical protein
MHAKTLNNLFATVDLVRSNAHHMSIPGFAVILHQSHGATHLEPQCPSDPEHH